MIERMTNTPANAAKTQTLEVIYKGRSYIIVNEGQMEYQRMFHRELLLCDMPPETTEEEINLMVDKWAVEECAYATLDHVLGLMTPTERQQWRDNYRFAGVSKRK